MFRVVYFEVFGPFCGMGGYGGGTAVGLGRSPKKAYKAALRNHSKLPMGGGVPVLAGYKIYNPYGKLIKEVGDI